MTALDAAPRVRDALMPASADGRGMGITLSVVVHIGLLVALTLSVRWHTQTPDAAVAELWSAVPRQAAPPAAAPPEPEPEPKLAPKEPPPPDPREKQRAEAEAKAEAEREAQIAAEKAEKAERKKEAAEKAKLEKAKAEKEKAEKEKAEKEKEKAEKEKEKAKAAKAEEAKLSALRQQNLKRLQSQMAGLGEPTSTSTAPKDSGPSAGYAGRIKARVKPNIVFTEDASSNPTAEVELRVDNDGNIVERRILKGSGNRAWDEAVLRAVDKTAVLPKDVDGRIPPVMVIRFQPNE